MKKKQYLWNIWNMKRQPSIRALATAPAAACASRRPNNNAWRAARAPLRFTLPPPAARAAGDTRQDMWQSHERLPLRGARPALPVVPVCAAAAQGVSWLCEWGAWGSDGCRPQRGGCERLRQRPARQRTTEGQSEETEVCDIDKCSTQKTGSSDRTLTTETEDCRFM